MVLVPTVDVAQQIWEGGEMWTERARQPTHGNSDEFLAFLKTAEMQANYVTQHNTLLSLCPIFGSEDRYHCICLHTVLIYYTVT
jgi:hypothetical protein